MKIHTMLMKQLDLQKWFKVNVLAEEPVVIKEGNEPVEKFMKGIPYDLERFGWMNKRYRIGEGLYKVDYDLHEEDSTITIYIRG